MKSIRAFILLFLFPLLLHGQQAVEVEKSFFLDAADTSLFLDFLILPETVQVTGALFWDINYSTGFMYVRLNPPEMIRVSYQRIPVPLPRITVSYTMPDTSAPVPGTRPIRYQRPSPLYDPALSTRLDRSGSISRGIIVGSNRDLSLESGLRFDLSGYITDDVHVLATLTDNSTPIQPGGTTQQLREFDQVYIRLTHEKAQLQLGDVDVAYSKSRFLKYNRRLQGADVRASPTGLGDYKASAAVIRGTFRVLTLQGRDGVQGPYRLSGADNEPFVMILAGTENVYINGRRLNRGEENDYIIDYGLGEIVFTSKWLMSDDYRITVDYQYLSSGYTRTITAADAATESLLDGTLTIGVSYLREADDIRFADQLGISETERNILRNAGDDLSNAIVSGADSVGFRRDADFVLYVKKDTVFAGEVQSIFQNIPGNPNGHFRVFFSQVGQGNGSYKRGTPLVNGIVYEWVGPGLGDYEPFRQLRAPREQQMATIRSVYQVHNTIQWYTEYAMSSTDENRFSPLDARNNTDHAWTTGITGKTAVTRWGVFGGEIRHRYLGKNFKEFDRIRDVEHERRWNIANSAESFEMLHEAMVQWVPADHTSMELDGGLLQREEVNSSRVTLNVQSAARNFPSVQSFSEWVQSENSIRNDAGSWIRASGETSYDISVSNKTITPTFRWDFEENRQKISGSDSLLAVSARYRELTPGLLLQFGPSLSSSAAYGIRQNEEVREGRLNPASTVYSGQFETRYEPSSSLRTTNRVGWRNRKNEPYYRLVEGRENVSGLLMQSVTDVSNTSKSVDMQLFYDVSSESRALYTETFIETGPEFGQYVWIDLNGDGVQQIDEFFPEQSPNEGTHILQFLPSDELIPVTSVQARFRIRIDPARSLRNVMDDNGFYRFVSGTVYALRAEIREQSSNPNLADIYLLRLNTFLQDSTTVTGRMALMQELQLFRRSPAFDGRIESDMYRSKQRFATGLEESKGNLIRSDFNYRFPELYVLGSEFRYRSTSNLNEGVESRNYIISGVEWSPYVRILYDRSAQATVKITYQSREDEFPALPVQLRAWRFYGDTNLNVAGVWSVFLKLELRDVQLSGISSPLASYEITDGAGEGTTWNWSAQINYKVSDFMRANLSYDGRTVTDRPSIQTLRLTVTAVF